MPIPFLLAGASILAGAIGVTGHISAKETNEKAMRKAEMAEELYDASKVSFEKVKSNMEDHFLSLGNTKKEILETSINRFVEDYKKIKNINFNNSSGIYEISNLQISSNDVVELTNIVDIYSTSALSGAAGAATGALVGLAANGTLPIVAGALKTAAAGVAIGEIGGAVSLAGSALSLGAVATPLASIVAPVVLFTGISASSKADENLSKAEAMYSKARAASEKMKLYEDICNAAATKSDMFKVLLTELNEIFSQCVALLNDTVRMRSVQFRGNQIPFDELSIEEKNLLMVTGSLAKAVKTVIDTPILDENGKISPESEEVYEEISTKLPAYVSKCEEVQAIDYGNPEELHYEKKKLNIFGKKKKENNKNLNNRPDKNDNNNGKNSGVTKFIWNIAKVAVIAIILYKGATYMAIESTKNHSYRDDISIEDMLENEYGVNGGSWKGYMEGFNIYTKYTTLDERVKLSFDADLFGDVSFGEMIVDGRSLTADEKVRYFAGLNENYRIANNMPYGSDLTSTSQTMDNEEEEDTTEEVAEESTYSSVTNEDLLRAKYPQVADTEDFFNTCVPAEWYGSNYDIDTSKPSQTLASGPSLVESLQNSILAGTSETIGDVFFADGYYEVGEGYNNGIIVHVTSQGGMVGNYTYNIFCDINNGVYYVDSVKDHDNDKLYQAVDSIEIYINDTATRYYNY